MVNQYGTDSADFLDAQSDQDVYGGLGDDWLTSPAYTYTNALIGGAGDDVYVVNEGTGTTIFENGASSHDSLVINSSMFGAGHDVHSYNENGKSLAIGDRTTGSYLVIIDWLNPANRIEKFLINNTLYNFEQFRQLVIGQTHYHGDTGYINAQTDTALSPEEANFINVAAHQVNGMENQLEISQLDQLYGTGGNTVYRFFNVENGHHFYTASAAERDSVVNLYDQFQFEGPVYRGAAAGGDLENVYRFYNARTSAHFYTASVQERDYVQQNLHAFAYEGAVYQAHATGANGSEALYRFYDTATQTHFYTADVNEKNAVTASLPNYHYEGIVYYVEHV